MDVKSEIQEGFNFAIEELGIEATLIQCVVMLHHGWEMDNLGFIAKTGDELIWICSSHGSWYLRRDFQELREKIQEYEQCLTDARNALSIVDSY